MNEQIMEIEIKYSTLLAEHAARAVFKGDSPEEVKRLSDEWQAEWDRISAEREGKIREETMANIPNEETLGSMTFLETLQAHRGGLLRIKSDLYWFGHRGWDKNPGRVCHLLDASKIHPRVDPSAATITATASVPGATALLLIDGAPRWVWVAEEDVEVIDEAG